MTLPIWVNIAVEDSLSDSVLRRLLASSGKRYEVAQSFSRGGFGYLKSTIKGFNVAARGTPFVVLTDLDSAPCASGLIEQWLPVPRHHNLLFRVAVREVEAWLLADRANLAVHLAVAESHIPRDPDALRDPKQKLIEAAKKSRRREIREAIVPARNTTAKQGPDYNDFLGRFVAGSWDPATAKNSSESLNRAIKCLNEFVPR